MSYENRMYDFPNQKDQFRSQMRLSSYELQLTVRSNKYMTPVLLAEKPRHVGVLVHLF